MIGMLFTIFGIGRKWFGLALSGAGALLKWLFADYRRIIIAGLIIALGFTGHALSSAVEQRNTQTVRAVRAENDFDRMKMFHAAFVADLQAKQAAARAADAANAAGKLAAQKTQNERINDVFENRLNDRDLAVMQLRQRLASVAAARDKHNGGNAAMPGDFAAECRAFGSADCNAFFAALPGILAAAETNSAQLIGLQDWARGVMAIINEAPQDPAQDTAQNLLPNLEPPK